MPEESKVSASEVIFHYFREKIKSGELKPGDPLPSERTLQKKLGVSRFSLREGLARLNAIGAIDTHHGKTTRVSQQVNMDSLKNVFLPMQAKSDTQSRGDLDEARVVLETEIAGLAAQRHTEKDLEGLRSNLHAAELALNEEDTFGSLDLEFHERIADAARNRFFNQMHAVIRDQLESVMKLHANAEEQRRLILKKNKDLFEAIEAGDARAARQLARDHLGVFKTHYTLAMATIIDLTHSVTPGDRGIEFEDSHLVDRDGWNARTWHLYSHSNTHMDAPKHFFNEGNTIDNTPLEVCIGLAWVIDLGMVEARQLHTVEDLGAYAEKIQKGDRILLKTGWERTFGSDEFRDGLPRISKELAEWFVEKGVSLIGVEPPSVADVNDLLEVTEIHQILLGANITIVESLKNLHLIKQDQVEFIALPLKLKDGDGSPVRALAIV